MKVLSKSKLETALNKLNQSAEVLLPMQKGKESGFFSWKLFKQGEDELMLDALNVYLSPKNVVLPQTERMYSIKQQGQEIKIDQTFEDASPRIIFGVRPCDLKAIRCMDEVFLTRGYEDSFYKCRRQAITIIANACYQPGPACFCAAMEVNPVEPEGADIIIRDAGEAYIWEAKTSQGEALTAQITELLEEKDLAMPESKPFMQEVKYEGVAEKLKTMFNSRIWERLGEACHNCGICTYVCPSCYCFDIQVKMWGDEGYRFRCWDSCMYEEYSREAGGGNPRGTGIERFRNRFLHKLEFHKERYGTPLCTGCGRCIVACPAGINIAGIIAEIKEAEADA